MDVKRKVVSLTDLLQPITCNIISNPALSVVANNLLDGEVFNHFGYSWEDDSNPPGNI